MSRDASGGCAFGAALMDQNSAFGVLAGFFGFACFLRVV